MRYLPPALRYCQTMLLIGCAVLTRNMYAADLQQLTADNYASLVPAGKETDAILGDWVLRNDQIVVVIAQPVAGRNANMTVRGVSGMIIDLTRRNHASDQLGCFYVAGGSYLFDSADSLKITDEDKPVDLSNGKPIRAKSIQFSLVGKPITGNQTEARVTYTLREGQPWLEYQVEVTNKSDAGQKLTAQASLRCDGTIFRFGNDEATRLFYAEDAYFGQCYGFIPNDGVFERSADKRTLQLKSNASSESEIASGEKLSWGGKVSCSQGLPGVRGWASGLATQQSSLPLHIKLQSPQGSIEHAQVELFSGEQSLGTIDSDSRGFVRADLLPGKYLAKIRSLGREDREQEFDLADKPLTETLSLPTASRVQASIVDGDGKPIPAKVQFIPAEGTSMPDFGPDSAVSAIKNVVYCATGKFEQPLAPGKYQALISHGPEYDSDAQDIEVRPGALLSLKSSLKRTVITQGWISSDFHSHSSPSGDNVSHQTGRVLNLLAEHIEFAPCTEHNRIDTYEDDLLLLKATGAMATCSGMELTGSPLPINHQNAFPLHRHEHIQDGGGPITDADPVKQIERLALWQSGSSKVVQTNHPNIPQILGDRDLDGQADEGFRGMLGWMDVIEVHPPEGIFNFPQASGAPKDNQLNPIFYWLQLLNLGYRIPGAVNTDAHYNFHGSGWLRNYMECSTDNPAEIQIDEMIHSAEHGHMVMTNGPFLETQVRLQRNGKAEYYTCGEDVLMQDQTANLWICVQCPNWFDVNRVQVFANGRPLPELNFTRKTHADKFSDKHVRFETQIELPKFDVDTHLIVATIGEGLTLGAVMGPDQAKLPPAAVANPIFLDVDGSGFKANRDDLGVPLMLPTAEQSVKSDAK